MKISDLIVVLNRVLAEQGDVDAVILDNDTEALIDVTRAGMTDDGRFAVYGEWSSAAPYGGIVVDYPVRDQADAVWGEVTGEGKITSVLLIDEGEVREMVEGATPVEITGGMRFAGRGSVVFDAEGRITRIVWDEEE